MPKRFTDTEKWRDKWFRSLSKDHKFLWLYVLDNCDPAGVWEFDLAAFEFFTGGHISEDEMLLAFDGRIQKLTDRHWFVPAFINFQYGTLSPDCKPHGAVYRALAKHGIDPANVQQSHAIGKSHNVSAKTRKGVLDRDNHVCCYCGLSEMDSKTEVIDHVIPRKHGGTDTADNLVACCLTCNSRKCDLTLEDFCKLCSLNYSTVSDRVLRRVLRSLKEKEKDKEEDKEKKPIELPPILDSPEFRSALESWVAYRGSVYKPRGLSSLLKQAAKRAEEHGLPAVLNAFEVAESNGWTGWNQDGSFRKETKKPGGGQKYDEHSTIEAGAGRGW